jgi:pimeloyl-ACP methyl ester carboxylesterase
VNYRGVDGYGHKFSELKDAVKAADDVMLAYTGLTKDPAIDVNNVFLFDTSGGSSVTTELVAGHPELWRGIVLDHSVLFELDRLDPSRTPPIFYFAGDQDPILPAVKSLESWSAQNHVKISGLILPHSGHYVWKDETGQLLPKLLGFYYDNGK